MKNDDLEICASYTSRLTFHLNERRVHASDFSELGEYKFRLLCSPTGFSSVCHQVEMYQDGAYLGEAYYNGLLMPRE